MGTPDMSHVRREIHILKYVRVDIQRSDINHVCGMVTHIGDYIKQEVILSNVVFVKVI